MRQKRPCLEPSTFAKRWSRSRRVKEFKGVPEVKTLYYPMPDLASPAHAGEAVAAQVRKDARNLFPRGCWSTKLAKNVFDGTVKVVVTQTRKQRYT